MCINIYTYVHIYRIYLHLCTHTHTHLYELLYMCRFMYAYVFFDWFHSVSLLNPVFSCITWCFTLKLRPSPTWIQLWIFIHSHLSSPPQPLSTPSPQHSPANNNKCFWTWLLSVAPVCYTACVCGCTCVYVCVYACVFVFSIPQILLLWVSREIKQYCYYGCLRKEADNVQSHHSWYAKPSAVCVFCGQALSSTESATSGQSATSPCLSALPGQLGKGKFVLDGLGWKDKDQRTYYSYTTTAWWLNTLRHNWHSSN